MRRRFLVRAVLLLVILLVGCRTDGKKATMQATKEPTAPASSGHSSASRVKSYDTLQQLKSESQAVVRVTATDTRTVENVAAPVTVTTVAVIQALPGSVTGLTIKVRQPGSPNGAVIAEDAAPLLQAGASYVIFLARFTYGPGGETDQYIPVGGGPGLFLDENGMLKRLDPQSPNLPAHITLADLQRSIAS